MVYELPQSRERIRGREKYLEFNTEYPGEWHLRPRVVVADERRGVVVFDWSLGAETATGIVVVEHADGRLTRVTDYWPDPYEPPAGREHLVERY